MAASPTGSNVKVCPVWRCESLILPTRLACYGHLRSLPDDVRSALDQLARYQPGSAAHLAAEVDALAYLDRLQPRRAS